MPGRYRFTQQGIQTVYRRRVTHHQIGQQRSQTAIAFCSYKPDWLARVAVYFKKPHNAIENGFSQGGLDIPHKAEKVVRRGGPYNHQQTRRRVVLDIKQPEEP